MTFANYQNSNNASSKLLADISASTTIILITSGEEALFPNSYPFLLTIEKVNSDGNVILREIVKVVSGNQNSFVVERGAGKCVQDDTATTRVQSNATHSFSAGDRISLYWTAEQVKDIQDDLNSKLSIEEYQSGNYVYGASTTGNDDYAITLPIAPTSYAIGQVYRFLAGTENTGPATLNVNGLGAIPIMKNHDVQLDTGDIEAGQIVEVAYDGTNFQMNSQTATIVDMKDIKTLSCSGLKAGEDLQEGDVVQVASKGFSETLATESLSLGGVSSLKGGIGFEANGDTIQDLQIKASVIEGTTPTAITVNLESDNNGSPSGTSLGSVDILNQFKANTNISSITETTIAKHFGISNDSGFYIGGGNLGKTRCFYWIPSTSSFISSGTYSIYRNILNEDSNNTISYIYTLSFSALRDVLGLGTSATQINFYTFYIDQDFKFLFLYEYTNNSKIYKLGFNAPDEGGEISSFTNLGSRDLSTVGITTASLYTQIAFSDDGMFAYTDPKAHSSSIGSVHAFQLASPYDLTGATEIGTSWSTGSYSAGPCYMSLGNGKKYIIAGRTNNRFIEAREINSDGTISSTDITIRSGDNNAYHQYGLSVRNLEDGGAAVCTNYHYSSAYTTHTFTLGSEFKFSPSAISFSFSSPIPTIAGQKYWITIYPTGDSVQNYVNLYSYGGNEHTSLSKYTDSWSSVSNMSPYLSGDGIKGIYIRKQIDSQIPFGNYGIADNNYEAFSQARFVNMGISNHNSGLITSAKYFMQDGELNLDSGQYVGTAINETTLNVGKYEAKDQSSKLSNIVSQSSPNATAYGTDTEVLTTTAKVDGYYSFIGSGTNSNASYRGYVRVVVGDKITNIDVNGGTNFRGTYFRSGFVKKGTTITIKAIPYDSSHGIYRGGGALYGPDGSI